MIVKPFRKCLPVGGWWETFSMMYSNVVDIEEFEKWEAILEAPFQLLLQLFIISRGRTAGKYQKDEARQMTY